MRTLVWIAPLLATLIVLCASCAGVGDDIVKPEVVRSADIVREDEGVTSRYFGAENPYTLRRAAEVREDAVVQTTLRAFGELGYAHEAGMSFVAEGEGPDGKRVEIVALTMTAGESGGDVVYALDIRSSASRHVVPLRVAFADAPTVGDAYEFGEGAWFALAGEPVSGAGYGSAARISWSQWAECVATRSLAGLATCAWVCRYSFGMYLTCLATCTEGYVIYALVYCTIQQL